MAKDNQQISKLKKTQVELLDKDFISITKIFLEKKEKT